jgi:sigma-54 specific flagellar transcriptional regulator A
MLPDLVGTSVAIRRLRGQVAKIADSSSPVLLTGEKGTGQLEVARALHRASPRSREPFVPVDCAAIPADVLESELFGHEKGAFAGALTKKLGRFELAAGGTIFLDSIGAVPLSLQGKLLRAIQHGQIERLGGAELIAVTARIVAAATPELTEMIGAGGFREDLHRALGICTIEVPALRERAEDLPSLIAQVASRVEAKHGVTLRLAPEALDALGAYEWPRNLRELEHIVERLALMHGNELIGIDHLPVKLHAVAESAHDAPTTASGPGLIDPDRLPLLPVNGLDLRDYLTRLERSLIQQALNDTHHVVARAADRLHIRRTTLVEKMRKYGLSRLEPDAIAPGAVARGATQ